MSEWTTTTITTTLAVALTYKISPDVVTAHLQTFVISFPPLLT